MRIRTRTLIAELVLGVNIMCDSNVSLLFAAAHMTSPRGKSHTFDARADGYARGEACCCVALMPESESGEFAVMPVWCGRMAGVRA